MDELLVGPRGVAVLDSKAWSQPVRVESDRLYVADRRRTQAIDGVLRQVRAVEAVLAESGYGWVVVRGFIALTDHDRGHLAEEVRDVWIIGLDRIEQGFSALPRELSDQTVAELVALLGAAFPPCCDVVVPASPSSTCDPCIERDVRLFYIRPWRNRRLYVKSAEGADVGWIDPRSGQIDCAGKDQELVRALLHGASFAGIRASSEDLPRLRASPAKKHSGNSAWVSVLVGTEWFGRGKHRLYGTFLVPDVGSFSLGYADLATGRRSPSVVGTLAPNLATADEYLRVLWTHWPGHRHPPSGEGQAS